MICPKPRLEAESWFRPDNILTESLPHLGSLEGEIGLELQKTRKIAQRCWKCALLRYEYSFIDDVCVRELESIIASDIS